METQKAVLLIVGVLVAGLLIGYSFSGKRIPTGQVPRPVEGGDDAGGCPPGTTPVTVHCDGVRNYICVKPDSEINCRGDTAWCSDSGELWDECERQEQI